MIYLKNKLAGSVDVSERIQMHSLPFVSTNKASVNDKQLAYIKKLLANSKHSVFFDSIRLPLYTTQLVGKVVKRNKKVFSGKNPFLNIVGNESFVNKLKDEIGSELEEIKLEFYNALYHNSQDVLIVNIVSGKHVFQIIPISSITEIKENNDKEIELIRFKVQLEDKEIIAEINTNDYRLIDGKIETVTFKHKLGYCPALYIESETFDNVKNGLLLSSLSDLDWILFFAISKRLNDLTGAFPIISVYDQDCEYQHEDYVCQKGILVSNESGAAYYDENKNPLQCPICSNRMLLGVGTVLKIEIPDKDGISMMPPINVTPGDIPSLEYCTKELTRLENEFVKSQTGYEIEIPQALNEKQIQSMFEHSKTIINDIARKLERLINWYYKTKSDLAFGLNQIKSVKYSFGTEFFLYTDNELLNIYIDLRAKNADVQILDSIYLEYLETKYKNDLNEFNKQKTLFLLDTFRHNTTDQVINFISVGIAKPEDLIFKLRKVEIYDTLSKTTKDLFLNENLKTILYNQIKTESNNDTGTNTQ